MKKVTITKLNVSSVGRFVGVYQAIVGFIVGLILSLGSIADVFSASDNLLRDLGITTAIAVFAVILFPIFGFIVGWVQGVITAFILNIIFAEANGLEIEIKESK
jgi:hypothetical protein